MPEGLHSQCWTMEQELAYCKERAANALTEWGKARWANEVTELEAAIAARDERGAA